MNYDLEFEQPLAELHSTLTLLQQEGGAVEKLQIVIDMLAQRTKDMYANLTAWQTVQVARHKDRPYTADYIRLICDDFLELHGDRAYGDDPAIVAGLADIDDHQVMLIGQQKGRAAQEKQFRNYGMPHPEGYRKAYRLMEQAEKFSLPLVCLIDTPGAFPGLEDEERGQAEAIAANLYLMSRLRVPIISIVLGEGCSGGALAISIADRLLMLEHSVYTVAAPEAAASILWRDTAFASEAADTMKVRARDLKESGVIDDIIAEPAGGAHRNYALAAATLKEVLIAHLDDLAQYSIAELLDLRYAKYRSMGSFKHMGRRSLTSLSNN
jgi:acetyl-CoA carboxylase carboxyl transferase subunit alpha